MSKVKLILTIDYIGEGTLSQVQNIAYLRFDQQLLPKLHSKSCNNNEAQKQLFKRLNEVGLIRT